MANRVRLLMKSDATKSSGGNDIEIDETYLGASKCLSINTKELKIHKDALHWLKLLFWQF